MHTVCIREYIIILDISIMWIIVLYSRASTSLVCIICKYSTLVVCIICICICILTRVL